MKVIVDAELVRVEVHDRNGYTPDVLEDMVNRATHAALWMTKELCGLQPDDSEGRGPENL